MKTTIIAMVGALSALAFASHASADTYTITYSGVVTGVGSPAQDVDIENLFGGGNLTGDAVSIVVTYGTTLGSTEATTSTSDQLYGGADYYNQVTGVTPASPILSEAYTIAGHTYTFTPNYLSIAYTKSGTASTGEVYDTADSTAGDSSLITLYSANAGKTLSTTGTLALGTASKSLGTLATAFDSNNNDDVLSFTTTGAVVAAAAAVSAAPEPSTWALMIMGIGVVGYGLRRRYKGALGSAVAA